MFGDNNLFNPQWTTGSLSAISPIVQVVGFVAMGIISIGGFFMVILPLIRNVFNGIVVVAPKLCDKIDEAHRNKLGLNHSEGGNQIQMIIGSMSMIILSFFPNFKALSDFDEGIIDPKTYMIKALPMMCVYIFIGVFIFQGYPAKFAEKFAGAATGVIDMALNNVDPVAWVEKIPTNLARPDLSTNNATDQIGKNTNTLSKSLFSTLTSKYSDMSKDSRISVSHEIEAYVNAKLSEISDHADSSKFKMTVETRVMGYDPQLNEKAVWPTPAHDEANNIYIYQFKDQVSGSFNTGVPGGTDGDYFMGVLKFYELADKADKASNIRNRATLGMYDGISLSDGQGTSILTLPKQYFAASNSVTINGIKSSKIESNTQGNSESWKITFPVSKQELQAAPEGNTSGLFYVDSVNRGYQHTITSVKWGGSTIFEPEDSARYGSWTLGGSPSLKKVEEDDKAGRESDNN